MELHTASNSALLYSASDIDVLDEVQIEQHPFLRRMGPDLLGQQLTREVLSDRLASTTFRGRAVGTLYLDQAFVAGLGNYLRSEILFLAHIHPKRRPAGLQEYERRNLASETLRASSGIPS